MSRARLSHRDGFRPKLIALSVAACFSVSATNSSANPTGGTVSSGNATFAASGNTLTITNTANTIINWQSFSIGVNEITRFLQNSGSSAVLNRVVGTNGVVPKSIIDGVLQSNGRVFLLNPGGVVIGATGRVDVAGFVASSLSLSDQDFKDGRMRFTATPGAGQVSNAGVIDTSSGGPGGRVYLVGPDVQNSGVIRSPQGEIVLAAGKSVELASENSPFVTVSITADTEQALNVGKLIADSGRIGMFGALVRQGGVVEANSAVAGANGEIRLVATKDLTLDEGSITTANGASGGKVLLQALDGTNLVAGTVEAKGDSGQGGTIQALGVRVGLVGKGVIDASGETGGGTVLVGGDYQGGNPNIQNARQTVIGSDGVIRADARTTGDGGRVIVWADESTKFFGSISARGGAQGGDGGLVETSGKALQAFGSVDTRAPNGKSGTWLLDPDFIQIIAGGNATLGCATLLSAICFDDPLGGTSQISPGTIDAGLRTNGFVTLQAHQDIDFLADLSLGAVGIFNAQAGKNINLGVFNITGSGTTINLSANDAASASASGTGSITSTTGGNITTNGGNVNLSGYGVTVGAISTGGVLSSAGTVNIAATGDIKSGALSTQSTAGYAGGSITLASNAGTVTVSGDINTTGAQGAGSVTITAAGDIASGSITTQSVAPVSFGSNVDLNSSGGKVTVNGSINTSGASGAAGGIVDGSSGGGVDITSAGAVGITGGIITSGGDGATPVNGGTGGFGGSAGAVVISGGAGDTVIGGGVIARGGKGADGTLGGFGGSGGSGGAVILATGGNVSVGSGGIDVSGGLGGAGSPATAIASPVPGGNGGIGGSSGIVELAGQNITVNGTVLAVGGAGGAGGDGIALSPTGGAGGAGGSGGLVAMSALDSVTAGTIRADGGAGGAGGAYGGAGGSGGGAFFFVSAPARTTTGRAPAFTLPASLGLGSVVIDAPTLVQAPSSLITANGGAGGAGGGVGPVGGNGGNGGNGGALILAINGSPAAGSLSVLGGLGGAGGASALPGIPGVAGLDGTIAIGRSLPPEVGLDTNTVIQGTNQLLTTNNAPSSDELEKRNKENKQKKEAAVCK